MGNRLHLVLRALWADCSAATALEYALIAIFISIIVVTLTISIGSTVCGFFMSVNAGF